MVENISGIVSENVFICRKRFRNWAGYVNWLNSCMLYDSYLGSVKTKNPKATTSGFLSVMSFSFILL